MDIFTIILDQDLKPDLILIPGSGTTTLGTIATCMLIN
jgi:hypothetical protein